MKYVQDFESFLYSFRVCDSVNAEPKGIHLFYVDVFKFQECAQNEDPERLVFGPNAEPLDFILYITPTHRQSNRPR